MRKFTFLFFICISSLATGQTNQTDPNGPVMTFDSTTFDFGTVVEGTIVKKDFHYTNTGKEPLIITRASNGCYCVVADWSTHEPLAPGKSGIMTVYFNTAGQRNWHDKGVTVESNSSNGPIVLHITGIVIFSIDTNSAVMTFDSLSYDFGTIKQGDVISHDFHFTNTGKSPLLISETRTSDGGTMATYPKEPIPPGGKGVIKWYFNSTGKMGTISKTVIINYNSTEVIVLYVTGNVAPK